MIPIKNSDQSLDLCGRDERHWSSDTEPATPNHIEHEGTTMIAPETTRPAKRGRNTADDELLRRNI